ncbi:MAG: 2-oxo acid dehydrogenase subunit E2, partial [Clostridia bacterium]
MATPVIMPRQGQSVESCIIAKWGKKKGDIVAIGDLLFSYETDKASFEETAKVGGTMLEIFFDEGDDVPCLTNVCVIGNAGEDAAEFSPNGAESAPTAAVETQSAAPVAAVSAPVATHADGEMKISPRAKNLAERTCANLSLAEPTGPHGRVIERDVNKLIADGKLTSFTAVGSDEAAGTGVGGRVLSTDAGKVSAVQIVTKGDTEEIPHSNIRKVIAKSMHASLANMAQLTLNTTFDATAIQSLRKVFKEKGEAFGMEKVTLNDMILFAVSRIILKHPDLNAHYFD